MEKFTVILITLCVFIVIATELIVFNTFMALGCVVLATAIILGIMLIAKITLKSSAILILGVISIFLTFLLMMMELIYNHSIWIFGCVIYFIFLFVIEEIILYYS